MRQIKLNEKLSFAPFTPGVFDSFGFQILYHDLKERVQLWNFSFLKYD